jgi:hypothetical protein
VCCREVGNSFSLFALGCMKVADRATLTALQRDAGAVTGVDMAGNRLGARCAPSVRHSVFSAAAHSASCFLCLLPLSSATLRPVLCLLLRHSHRPVHCVRDCNFGAAVRCVLWNVYLLELLILPTKSLRNQGFRQLTKAMRWR